MALPTFAARAGWARTVRRVLTVCAGLAASGPCTVLRALDTPFALRDATDLGRLEDEVARSSADVAPLRGDAAVRRAELDQARLWDNPALHAAWSTLPVGTTTPPDLPRPYAQVPSYAVELSYGFLVGKRAPRIRSAQGHVQAAEAELRERARALALELAAVVAQAAAATMRRENLLALVEDAAHDQAAAEVRLSATYGTPLEVDRLGLEAERARQHVLAADAAREQALARCAAILGRTCTPFADAAEARAYFTRWIEAAPTQGTARIDERPDLRALTALESASRASAELAHATRYPDPTLSLGYVHDRFVISGNQRNALNVGVSLPLPLVDAGRAREAGARARTEALAAERTRRKVTAQVALAQLERVLSAERAKLSQLSDALVPRARAIVDQLETAVQGRLVPLGDLIQARRTLDELLVQESDGYLAVFQTVLDMWQQTGSGR